MPAGPDRLRCKTCFSLHFSHSIGRNDDLYQSWPCSSAPLRSLITARYTLVQSAVLRSHVVCPSICDVGGLWSHRLEFFRNNLTNLVSLGCSLSADRNIRGLLQGEHPEIWAQSDPPPVDLSVGDIRSQITAKWLQIAQRSQWRAYRKPHRFFEYCRRWPATTSPSSQNGNSIYAPKIREWPYLRNGWSDTLHVWF